MIACALVLSTLGPRVARAQAPGLDVDPGIAAAITGAALAGTVLVALAIPVPDHDARTPAEDAAERFGFDEASRGWWSQHAHGLSNATLIASMALPAVAHLAVDAPDLDGAMWVYGESVSTTLLLNNLAKRVVQRRRPYSYGESGVARSREHGSDAYQSFYSGHTAASFAAVTSGALAMAYRTDDLEARALAWSLGIASATATAVLRVRAGRHYTSDVVVGAVAGLGMGALFPLIHGGSGLELSMEELAASLGGVAAGVLFGTLWPLDVPGIASVGPADREGGLVGRVTLSL